MLAQYDGVLGAGGATTYFAHTDHLGSTRVLTTVTATLHESYDHYPFGGERVVTSISGNTYKFTCKERDTESNLGFFTARHYSSILGRFLSPDEFIGGPVDAFSSNDPNRPGWRHSVRVALARAKRLADRLPTKLREDILQQIRTIEGMLEKL